MTSLSAFYEKNLYPLQDGVLKSVGACETHLYLTGGTALSRGYFNHRYSEDLDFFVNNDSAYDQQVNTVLERLRQDGFWWNEEMDYFRSTDFCTLKVRQEGSEAFLKIDFVNDVAPRVGEITRTAIFRRTDSIRNMLANKITALSRFEGKDVADVIVIARNYSFNWIDLVQDARKKEAGIELPVLAEILKGMPRKVFDSIRWVISPDWHDFVKDIDVVVRDMVNGSENSLLSRYENLNHGKGYVE